VSEADVVGSDPDRVGAGPVLARKAHECSRGCAGVDRVDDDRAARVGEMREQQQAGGAALDQLDAVRWRVAVAKPS
jgi:hypothetical protein